MFEEEEEEEEYGEKKTWKDYVVTYSFMIIAVALIIFFRGRWGEIPIDRATLGGFGIILVGFTTLMVYNSYKNKTPKIVYNWGFDTTDGELIACGNYFVLRPAIKAFGMYWKMAGAYIFPLDAVSKSGPNINLKARMESCTLDELPVVPRSFIVKNNIKPPYRLGFADEEQYASTVENPDSNEGVIEVSHLITEVKELNKENSFLRRIIRDKLKDMETIKEWADRMGEKKSFAEYIKGAIIEEGK